MRSASRPFPLTLRVDGAGFRGPRRSHSTAATETPSVEEFSRRFSSELMRKHYPPYKSAVIKILSSREFKSKKASLLGQGLWNDDVFREFELWLLRTKPVVDERSTSERWERLRKEWISGLERKIDNGPESTKEGPLESSRMRHLASQLEALESTTFANAAQSGRGTQQEKGALLRSQSFSRMVQFIFHKLVDYCVGGSNSRLSVLHVAWFKMKESGAILKRSKIQALLNAMPESTRGLDQSANTGFLFEEIAMYRDILSGDTSEASFYQGYPAILRYYCEAGDVGRAFAVLRNMQELPLPPFDANHYMMILATIARNVSLRTVSGMALFEEVASDMAIRATEISPSSATRLADALGMELEKNIQGTISSTKTKDRDFESLKMARNRPMACRVEIDPRSRACPVTNVQFDRSFPSLNPSERKQMRNDLLSLASERSTKDQSLIAFSDWMDNREGHPFTVILDGANVGKVQSMVSSLEAQGEYPLVVLPQRRAAGQMSSITHRLRRRGTLLYIVQDGQEDDLFCMIATLSDQKRPCSNYSHRRASAICLISNDHFRDYRCKLKGQILFDTWYRYHCHSHSAGVTALPTETFKRRIERNKTSMIGKVWHFPVNGWGSHDRFLVWLPTNYENNTPQGGND